ncbi:polyadenylate-binding protein 2-like [Homarus americanus]|uniref:Polyadenylate-binding protein 3-like n=1 Tax=Homarus americanus TaxID=6706 RepID=A0A8J5JWN6_HOMAM|nr:polyadenylate-binding protein 2-like [Homarus americanus]KAG7165207.1 Polyadenylate-binding protein 3-like [Homarus americanus]
MDYEDLTLEDLTPVADFGEVADIDFTDVKCELKNLLQETTQVRHNVRAELDKMKDFSKVCPKPTRALPKPCDDVKNKVDVRSVYIGSLDGNITEEDLVEHFQLCGVVKSVNIQRKTSGKSKGKGFAYILFKDKFSVDLALTLNGCACKGVKLKVEPKNTDASTSDRQFKCSSKMRRHNQSAGNRRLALVPSQ